MLLKWVVTIYDLIDSKDKIANMYGILFHFLDSELLRYAGSLLYHFADRAVLTHQIDRAFVISCIT